MRVTGIIAEYNPFHQGHKYHLEKAMEITRADYTIVAMSGDFTQRGAPAIMDKYSRARQSLENGADLVLELPACFATASAENFAFGGISLLHKLGVVNHLVFGSEEGSVGQINKAASFLEKEPEEYKQYLQAYLKQGFSYPKARSLSLEKCLPEISMDFLSRPNNILGVEYCRALLRFHSNMEAVTIPRVHNQYHDTQLAGAGNFSSATAIREAIKSVSVLPQNTSGFETTRSPKEAVSDFDSRYLLSALKNQVPDSVYEMIQKNYGKTMPIYSSDFSALLQYKLLLESKNDLSVFADVSSDLADRIKNNMDKFKDFESFCELLKTKEMTYSRISRGLLHILLDMKELDLQEYRNSGYARYARILGFRKKSAPLLHEIKKNSKIPLISKLADSVKTLDPLSLSMLETDMKAAHVYGCVTVQKYQQPFQNELAKQMVIL